MLLLIYPLKIVAEYKLRGQSNCGRWGFIPRATSDRIYGEDNLLYA